jgi:NAD/NADP transhydrogenase beta subunit
MIYSIVQTAIILSTALFIFSLHWMKDPKTARHGVFAGIAAMTVAIISTI